MYTKTGKNKLITEEKNKLERIFADLPEDKKQIIGGLVEQAAFLRISVRDLQNDINEHGYSTASPQGVKKRPEADLHTSWIKNYQSVIKQLEDISGKNVAEAIDAAEAKKNAEFEEFLAGNE